jgi:hypothetical protein
LLGAETVNFAFNFKNSSKSPVQFEPPVASCGCTLTKWEKTVYAPGESGTLNGTFSTIGRHGLSLVTIAIKGVEVDGDLRRPFEDSLKLSVTVSDIVKISPGILLWRKDSAQTTKLIRFEVNETIALPLVLTSPDDEAFTKEWKIVAEGKIYELKVTPRSTALAKQAMVTVEGANKEGKTLRFYAHLMIR